MPKRIITATELANFLGLPTDNLLSFVVAVERMSINVEAKYLAATHPHAPLTKRFLCVEIVDDLK